MAYKIKFMDSIRFITRSVSSLADNLFNGLHKDKCKKCGSELEYVAAKEKTLTFKSVSCNKNYEKRFDIDSTQICKRQQQVHEKLRPKQRILISDVLGCQQLVWVGDFRKVAHKWFQMEKR